MLAYRKPNQAAIITRGMTQAFIDELNKNKIDKDYWKECTSVTRSIPSSAMEKIKKMSNGED